MRTKILFVIDKVELRYFEFNQLVTSFWLIKECNERGFETYITTIDKLMLEGNNPISLNFKTELIEKKGQPEIIYTKKSIKQSLNDFDLVMFRPDPPVNMEYIFATYILDFVDKTKTTVMNSSEGIRKLNEKICINRFPFAIPENITSANSTEIKDFIFEHGEAVLKPLNKCFGKGVFYLSKEDKNINSIIETVTENGSMPVMVQKYLDKIKYGDKRIILIGGEVYNECVMKLPGSGDFKFTTHNDEFIKQGTLTAEEYDNAARIAPDLLKEGIHMAGLDVIDGKIIEINVTSPCFFIKEINQMFNIHLEKRIVDYMENCVQNKRDKECQRT